jgi:glycosyltransferase involved in cell wall biosynthesis
MLSVMCPAFNEELYIEQVLKFFITSKPVEKELFIIDGGSTDRTVEIIKKYLSYENIHLLHNRDKYVPYALNMAIPVCKGDVIARIDAHTEYSNDYFEKILETFEKTDADIVGGPYLTKYKSNLQCAVGQIISSRFGTGHSLVHDTNYDGYSDTVAYGAFKKEVFTDVGMFDLRLKRNQDDEFFYRAKSLGKKIYLNTEIKLWYYPRDSYKALFRQYWQYGIYKPLVLLKIKSEIKMRHLIPSLFSLYCFSLPIALYVKLWLVPLILYLVLIIIFSFKTKLNFKSKALAMTIFPTIHLAYGLGMVWGFLSIKKRI